MRGEEAVIVFPVPVGMELPPHARRRDGVVCVQVGGEGITSACAEKSEGFLCVFRLCRNYLRMRGEETALPAETLAVGVVL